MESCRVCLGKGANIRLFEKVECDLSLAHKYIYCTSIQISKRENFNDYICVNCVHRLNNFYDFKLQAEKSNKYLESSFNYQHNDIIENTTIKNHLRNSAINLHEKVGVQASNQFKEAKTSAEVENFYCNNNNVYNEESISIMNENKQTRNKLQLDVKNELDKCESVGKGAIKEKRSKKIKTHMCDICGKTFFDPYGLTLHKRCHTGVRPYKCHMCSHEFTQHHNMLRHISAKHYKERKYQCELCPAMFAYSSSLREHQQIHNGHKGHVCFTCGKQFSKRFSLSRHMVTHTDIKPFKCAYCSKSYTQSNDLKTHIKKIHFSSMEKILSVETVSLKSR